MRVSSDKRIAQVLFSLALNGSMSVYGLAKFISRYTGESFPSIRVILYRLLPVLSKYGFIKIEKLGRRNSVDVTIRGLSKLFYMFSDSPNGVDVDLIIAYSMERKYDVNGLLLLISLDNYPDYSDFLTDPFYPYPLELKTPSMRVVFNWDKKREKIVLKELNIDYDFILNNLSSSFWFSIENTEISLEYSPKYDLRVFLLEYLVRILFKKDLLILSFRFFEDLGKVLKDVLSSLFLISFSTDFQLLYYQLRIYEMLKSKNYVSMVGDKVFLPTDDLVEKLKVAIEEHMKNILGARV